jgi:hypothetical protein
VDPVKLFLSHASEDQPGFVRPLAEALSAFPDEFKVWYSEYELTLGDKLLKKIDEGLKNCDYGVVVLSPHFFSKRWPREELEGLFQLETTERKVILPIWKDVSESEVKSFSPILASRLGANAAAGIPRTVEDIRRAVGLVDRYKQISSSIWRDKLKKLDEDVGHARRVEQFSSTTEAVQVVSKVALELIDEAWKTAETFVAELSAVKFHLPQRKNERHYFAITGPNRLTLHLYFHSPFVNSIQRTESRVTIFRAKDDWDENSEIQILDKYELQPVFDKEMRVFWTDSQLTFATGTALLDFAFDKFVTALEADKRR